MYSLDTLLSRMCFVTFMPLSFKLSMICCMLGTSCMTLLFSLLLPIWGCCFFIHDHNVAVALAWHHKNFPAWSVYIMFLMLSIVTLTSLLHCCGTWTMCVSWWLIFSFVECTPCLSYCTWSVWVSDDSGKYLLIALVVNTVHMQRTLHWWLWSTLSLLDILPLHDDIDYLFEAWQVIYIVNCILCILFCVHCGVVFANYWVGCL